MSVAFLKKKYFHLFRINSGRCWTPSTGSSATTSTRWGSCTANSPRYSTHNWGRNKEKKNNWRRQLRSETNIEKTKKTNERSRKKELRRMQV